MKSINTSNEQFHLIYPAGALTPEGMSILCPGIYVLEQTVQFNIMGKTWANVTNTQTSKTILISYQDFKKFSNYENYA